MSLFLSSTAASAPEWMRKAATAVNYLLGRTEVPYSQYASAPANPVLAQTYYDTALNKVRTWDGSAWQNHW